MKWTILLGLCLTVGLKASNAQEVQVYDSKSKILRKKKEERPVYDGGKIAFINNVGIGIFSMNKNQEGFSNLGLSSNLRYSWNGGFMYSKTFRFDISAEFSCFYTANNFAAEVKYTSESGDYNMYLRTMDNALRLGIALGKEFTLARQLKYQVTAGPVYSFQGSNHHSNNYTYVDAEDPNNDVISGYKTAGGSVGYGTYRKLSFMINQRVHLIGLQRGGGLFIGFQHWWLGPVKMPHREEHPELKAINNSFQIGYNFMLR